MHFTPQINQALKTAASLHQNQIRKADGTPYITHPVAAAMIAGQYTHDEKVICAALLHDILEDIPPQTYSEQDMRQEFGPEIVKIVQGVSGINQTTLDEAQKKAGWKQRKQQYLDQLENSSLESLIVCAADKIHNMQSTLVSYQEKGEDIWQVFNSSKENKLWFYTEVVKIINQRLDSPIVAELNSVFGKYQKLIKG